MTAAEKLKPSFTRNMRLIGHSDQAGRSDGQQIMVRNGYAYIGHVCSKGFSVIDVRNPAKPEAVAYVQNPPNTWSLHLQVHDDLLLLVQWWLRDVWLHTLAAGNDLLKFPKVSGAEAVARRITPRQALETPRASGATGAPLARARGGDRSPPRQ